MKKSMLFISCVCIISISICLASCASNESKQEPVFIDQNAEKQTATYTESQTITTQTETSTTIGTTTTLSPIEYHSFTKISCSTVCSAAITSDGKLYTWGNNKDGSLGNGTTDNSYSPCQILENVKSVSFSNEFGAAITASNQLYLWGRNDDGQVGDGTRSTVLTPVKVLDNVADVQLGAYHTVALTTNGEMYAWGLNGHGQLDIDEEGSYSAPPEIVTSPVKVMDNIAKIVSGDASVTAAISNDGELYMFGMNYDGQIGDGKPWMRVTYPYKVMSDVSSAYVAEEYSAAITTSGELYMWGESEQRQLGITDGKAHYKPAFVMSNVKDLFFRRNTSYETVYAITNDNEMYAWGVNISSFGNDGESYQSPQKVMDNIKAVDSCGAHVLALTTDDRLLAWGSDDIWYNDTMESKYPLEISIIKDTTLQPVVNAETLSKKTSEWKNSQMTSLYDPDNFLSDADYKALVQIIHETGEQIKMNISVCILDSSGQNMSDDEISAFSDKQYDEWFNNLVGKDTDGLLLTLNIPTRYMYISTCGAGKQIYYNGKSDDRISKMLDNMKEYLRNDDYTGAIKQFCDDAVTYKKMGVPEISNEAPKENMQNTSDYIGEVMINTKKDPLNMRQSPDKESESVAKIPKGMIVPYYGTDGAWVLVKYDGKMGYIHSDYVVFNP